MNFLDALQEKFPNFFADNNDLDILNKIEIVEIKQFESKQRKNF